MLTVAMKVAALFLIPVAMACWWAAFSHLRVPREIRKKWGQLDRALWAVKHNKATSEDLSIVQRAAGAGILLEHLYQKDDVWHLYYSKNDVADAYYWQGIYPDGDEIREEVEA